MTLDRTTLLAVAVAGTSVFAIGAARAQPVQGLYVGAGAGYNLLQDLTTSVDTAPSGGGGVSASVPMKVKWGGGYLVSGSVGWGFGNGVRLELEGSYRDNAQSGGGGHATEIGVMGNALYDFDLGLGWVTPYVGLGAGYQAVAWDHVSGTANGLGAGPAAIDIDQTQGGFAYQVIVGMAFPIEQVPGLSVTAEYRYMNLAGARDYRATGGNGSVVATRAHVGEDGNHSILIGLRYAFGAPESEAITRPPPAPPLGPMPSPAAPTAAVMPARTYLVFFDWNSAALTPRARDIIAEAVRNSAKVAGTRIEVTGHADRSGTAQGNMVLSRRRVDAVATELERWGVPSTAIDIHAVGDTHLLVPTAAGVRQAENRRVEIVYR